MRKLLNSIGIYSLILIVMVVTVIYLAIDSRPRIMREVAITPAHIKRAKHILDTHRYRVYPGTSATVRIQPDDLDIALNYLAHHFGRGRGKTTLQDNSILVQLSLPVPLVTVGSYLNLQATLTETNGFPELKSVRIGDLPVPDILTNLLVSQLLAWLQAASPDINTGMDAFRKLQISRNSVAVSYYWKGWRVDKTSYQTLAVPLFNQQELDRLFRYHHFLNERNRHQTSQSISLSEVLTQMMRETTRYSSHENILEEFRAAMLVTAFHVLQLPLGLIIPEAAGWPRPVRIKVTLDGRADLAMHFMASAAITIYTDTILSNAVGLYKELEDIRSGSGFSFNDIIANRSGTSFAEKATADQDSARRMRNRILSGIRDTDLIPYWSDLPEHMSENTFRKHFGGTDTPQYHKIMDKIEQRVTSLKLLH